MAGELTGLKIRRLRKQAGLTQSELARRAGISPSYLNLIEGNKRTIAGGLLDRIATGLEVERALLDGEAERRIAETLNEIAADPVVAGGLRHPGAPEELVGRHPEWARLVLRLYQAYNDSNQAVLALADRLNRDPFLGESVHRILTHVTSIRSAAEIIGTEEPPAPEDQERFLSIIASDSEKLSHTAQSLADFFDSALVRVRSATPMEHVDAFILETDNHFPLLESFASDFLSSLQPGQTPDDLVLRASPQQASRKADPSESPESRRFKLLRDYAAQAAAELVEALVQNHPALPREEARQLAARALESYTAAAILMPYDSFLENAELHRYDLDRLTRIFGVSYEQAAHRLATLRRPGSEGVRFAFMRSDPSGYVTKRLPLPRLPLPRYGNACPLWVIHGAFQTPGVTQRAYGQLPSREQFLFFARAVEKRPSQPGTPRHLLSIMLACAAADAHRVSAGDGIDRQTAMVPVGTICRLCPRDECAHRHEAPLVT